jgi:hypothetical protein
MRYSHSRNAYVLRAVGNRSGPVLRLDRRRGHKAYQGADRRDQRQVSLQGATRTVDGTADVIGRSLQRTRRLDEATPVIMLEHALVATRTLKRIKINDVDQLLAYVGPEVNIDFARRFEILSIHLSDEDYWRVLTTLWVWNDRPGIQLQTWRRLFRATRPHRHLLMNEHEREILAGLAAHVEVFRGFCGHDRGDWHGISWTLDRASAEAFAQRWAMMRRTEVPRFVASATVARNLIVACFDRESQEGVEAVVPGMRGQELIITAVGAH